MTFSSCRNAKFPSPLFEKNVTKREWPTAHAAGLFADEAYQSIFELHRTGAHTPASPTDNVSGGASATYLLFPRRETTGCRSGSVQIKRVRAYICANKPASTFWTQWEKVVIRKGHRICYVSIKQKRFEMSNSCLQSVVWNVLNSRSNTQGVSHDFCQRRTAEFLQHASHRLLHGSSLQWATEGLVRASLALKTTIMLRYIVENIRLDNSETKTCSFEKI